MKLDYSDLGLVNIKIDERKLYCSFKLLILFKWIIFNIMLVNR